MPEEDYILQSSEGEENSSTRRTLIKVSIEISQSKSQKKRKLQNPLDN